MITPSSCRESTQVRLDKPIWSASSQNTVVWAAVGTIVNDDVLSVKLNPKRENLTAEKSVSKIMTFSIFLTRSSSQHTKFLFVNTKIYP